jgi:hypothetical protein
VTAFGDRSPLPGTDPPRSACGRRTRGRADGWRALCAAALAGLLGIAPPTVAGAPVPGPLTAQSIRGEPLRAVIALGHDRDGPPPSLRIAPGSTYARIGHPRDPALDDVRLAVASQPDGQRFLELAGLRPVDADEIVLVLESTDGSLRRLYRLPLGTREPADRVNVRPVAVSDRPSAPGAPGAPAVTAATGAGSTMAHLPDGPSGVGVRRLAPIPGGRTGSAPTAAPAPTPSPTASTLSASPAPTRPDPAANPPARRPAVITILEEVDLETLAAEFRPVDATLEQAAIAFWRLNRPGLPGRPPRPGAGTRLVVPTEDEMRAIDPQEARRFMAALARPSSTAPPGPAAR